MHTWLVGSEMQDLGRKERNMQEENNGQYVRYLIREWKVLCPFSLLFTHPSCRRIEHCSSHRGSKDALFHNEFHK